MRRRSFSTKQVVHALLHQQARTGAAHVSLVEEDALDDSLDGLIERRVLENDVRSLAAELESQRPCPCLRERALDLLADRGATGERDLVHTGMAHERGAGSCRRR